MDLPPAHRKATAASTNAPRGRGRPSIGGVLGPFPIPDDLRALVTRFQADRGFVKLADAVRTLLVSGLWAEGYDEAEKVRAVFASKVPPEERGELPSEPGDDDGYETRRK